MEKGKIMKRSLTKSIVLFLFFFLFSFPAKAATNEVNIESEAAVLIDANSGQVLYGKNENLPRYPASITKIATAIFAIENASLDEVVTVSEHAASTIGSSVYLESGEQITLEELLIGLLVNSGNDAAVAIAEHIGGTEEQFVERLNQFLEEKVGTENTHFVNPHGLYAEDHVTTAKDMAEITRYALRNETFRSLFQIQTYDWKGKAWETTLINHHRLVRGEFPYEGITGGKNGYTPESGFTLVTSATQKSLELIAVTLNAWKEDLVYYDTLEMLDYGFENFDTLKLKKGTEKTFGGQAFVAEEDHYYTVKKGEPVSETIKEDGRLVISQGVETIAEIQLQPVAQTFQANSENDEKEDGIENSQTMEWIGLSVLVVATVIFGVYVIRYRRIRYYE